LRGFTNAPSTANSVQSTSVVGGSPQQTSTKYHVDVESENDIVHLAGQSSASPSLSDRLTYLHDLRARLQLLGPRLAVAKQRFRDLLVKHADSPTTRAPQAHTRSDQSVMESKVSISHISDVGHRHGGSATNTGLNSDLYQPSSCTESIKHVDTPGVSTSPGYWSWRDGRREWHRYYQDQSELIDSKYLIDQKSSVHFQIEDNYYSIDFETMLQTNKRTGKKRHIRRTDIPLAPTKVVEQRSTEDSFATVTVETVSVLPATWNCDPNDNSSGFKLIEVFRAGDSTQEFTEIAELFERTMGKGRLKYIKRIENYNLYVAFQFYKKQMERKQQHKVDVRRLFHGTKGEFIEAICQHGFDWRIAGSSKGVPRYGEGCYFARDASYSKQYSDSRTMFLVQVMLTESKLIM